MPKAWPFFVEGWPVEPAALATTSGARSRSAEREARGFGGPSRAGRARDRSGMRATLPLPCRPDASSPRDPFDKPAPSPLSATGPPTRRQRRARGKGNACRAMLRPCREGSRASLRAQVERHPAKGRRGFFVAFEVSNATDADKASATMITARGPVEPSPAGGSDGHQCPRRAVLSRRSDIGRAPGARLRGRARPRGCRCARRRRTRARHRRSGAVPDRRSRAAP